MPPADTNNIDDEKNPLDDIDAPDEDKKDELFDGEDNPAGWGTSTERDTNDDA